MNQRALAEALAYASLEVSWRQILVEIPEASPEQATDAYRYIATLHEEIFATLQDATELEDRQQLVAVHFLRLRAHWTALNTQIGYQLATGRQDTGLFLRAALVSALAATLEPHLPPGFADTANVLLSNPLAPQATFSPAFSSPITHGTDSSAEGPLPTGERSFQDRERELLTELHTLKTQLAQSAAADLPPSDWPSPTLQQQLAVREVEIEMLLRECGANSVVEALLVLRSQVDRLAAQEAENYWLRYEQDRLREAFGDLLPTAILEEQRRQADEKHQLQTQISELLRERELLAQELACAHPDDLLRAIRTLRDTARDLSEQMAHFIIDRDVLQRVVGRSTPTDVVAYIRRMHDQLNELSREIAELRTRPTAPLPSAIPTDTRDALDQAMALLKK